MGVFSIFHYRYCLLMLFGTVYACLSQPKLLMMLQWIYFFDCLRVFLIISGKWIFNIFKVLSHNKQCFEFLMGRLKFKLKSVANAFGSTSIFILLQSMLHLYFEQLLFCLSSDSNFFFTFLIFFGKTLICSCFIIFSVGPWLFA